MAKVRLSKVQWEMAVKKMSSSKARRTDAEIKIPAHHTVEKSNFRCSCTFSEGSPHVTIPSRSLFFDKIFSESPKAHAIHHLSMYFFGSFLVIILVFLQPSKKRPYRRGRVNIDDILRSKEPLFFFHF